MSTEREELYAQHLSGMVKFPTRSYPDDSLVDYSIFEAFHKYLEKTYPLIHQKFERKVIGRASLLYTWKTAKPGGKLPLMLIAHQDVVPEGDESKWTHPPYSGEIADGLVWGRGSCDCKGTMLAELEAVEAMIADGFEPEFDVYLGFGHNEEVQAPIKGAKQIVEYLKSQNVRLGAVFDEGSGVSKGDESGYDGYIVDIRLGEKGYHDFELYKDTDGGHSMMPGQGTALGAVARAIVAIEEHPLPYRLTELTESWLKALSKAQTGDKALIYANPREHWNELINLAKEDKKLDSMLHTTFATTMASGSNQSNVLPSHASAIVNVRVLQGDTAELVEKYIKSIIPEDVQVRHVIGEGPEPASKPGGQIYNMISTIEKDFYGDKVLIIPSLLAGGTDAKYYTEITDNVFRFTGLEHSEKAGGAHGIDERYDYSKTATSVRFYTELFHRYQESDKAEPEGDD